MNPERVDISKATPRPWTVETPMGDECPWIVEAGKESYEWRCIAMVYSDSEDDIPPVSKAEAAANAAMIVRAVNRDHLFEEMVDLARNVGGFDDGLLRSADLGRLRAALSEYREQARAILAKVQS